MNFAKFLRTPFLQNTPGRLLLDLVSKTVFQRPVTTIKILSITCLFISCFFISGAFGRSRLVLSKVCQKYELSNRGTYDEINISGRCALCIMKCPSFVFCFLILCSIIYGKIHDKYGFKISLLP